MIDVSLMDPTGAKDLNDQTNSTVINALILDSMLNFTCDLPTFNLEAVAVLVIRQYIRNTRRLCL
jgi:hypothetical protein